MIFLGHFSEGGINDVAKRAFCSSVPALTRPRHHQDEQRGEGETSHGIREQPTCLARSRCGRCCSPATSSLSWSCPSITHQPTHLPPEQQHGRAHQPCHAEPGESALPQTRPKTFETGDSNGTAAVGCGKLDCTWSGPQACQVRYCYSPKIDVLPNLLLFCIAC